ncbi:MAG: TldD/PmbA family protein [Alphaproteobacteria bacterium]|nr:TldD/PmbA family protein [Alphaproteobacteria bacterium]
MNGDDARSLLDDLLSRAKKLGADAADALVVNSTSLSHAERLGKTERLERSESRDLGLRVFFGKQQAVVSSNDWDADTLDELVNRAVAMAKVVPEDPYCGLADPDALFTGEIPDLDTFDPVEPAAEALIDYAKAAEDAARAVSGVTNSEGAEASWSSNAVMLAASNGFSGGYRISRHGVGVSVIAGEGTGMERDYEFSSTVHGEDLDDAATVGRAAGERAVKRLNPRKASTAKAPVIYDPRVSNGLIGHLASGINGAAIARGTSFLKEAMGTKVFADGITIVDDPHRKRGLRSKPFDAEGLANASMNFIEDGVLTSWVMDLRSARQLGLESTARASRGVSGPPSPSVTNLYMAPGAATPEDLMADIKSGFYVTELMGFGIDMITGDYSRGAAGYWIENGELAYPVSEMTVAGNLKEMFVNLTPANNLEFKYGSNAPTIRIDGMTVAGE